jgi:hypothetical protein
MFGNDKGATSVPPDAFIWIGSLSKCNVRSKGIQIIDERAVVN